MLFFLHIRMNLPINVQHFVMPASSVFHVFVSLLAKIACHDTKESKNRSAAQQQNLFLKSRECYVVY